MQRNNLAMILLLGFAVVGLAVAAEPPSSSAPASTDKVKIDFGTLDKDSNGSLSKEEVKAVAELTVQFDTLDADHDRVLSHAEFLRWHGASTSAGKPRDPTTVPGGSAGAQHMPERD